MILQLQNESGVYEPLDLFDDFEIKYNHQYIDYKSIGSNRIPYTNNFKIPTTRNNRILTTVEFDATYPRKHSINGRALYSDGSIAFFFIADIDGQVTGVLEPYINISIIDLISKALSDLSKFKMSDLMDSNTFNLELEDWMFGDQSDLTDDEKYFLFPYFNFNNKNSIFAYDPMRNLTQLQPTFIIYKLINKIFDFVNLSVASKFLNNDNELAVGIKANELGLMIPCTLKTFSDQPFTRNQGFSGLSGANSEGHTERLIGVPSQLKTSSMINIGNLFRSVSKDGHCKFNYDWQSDISVADTGLHDIFGGRFCSMVDGKMNVRVQSNNTDIKPRIQLGRLYNSSAAGLNNFLFVQAMEKDYTTLDVGDLAIKMVEIDAERVSTGFLWTYNFYTQSDSYDVQNAQTVGTARYVGVNYLLGTIDYELDFDDDVTVQFDVKANQDMEYAFVVTPLNDDLKYTERFRATHTLDGGEYWFDMIITNGFIEYKMISTNDKPDSYFDRMSVQYTRPGGVNLYPTKMTFSFPESTDIPSGMTRHANNSQSVSDYINSSIVNMGESMKSVKDYSLIDIVKMIMSRFNLLMFTRADGTINIDSYKNMLSGEDVIIDHLINDGIDVKFTYSENGILSVKDSNPSFYDADYNKLDKLIISDDKRDEVTYTFDSAIYNGKMFRDVYDSSGYDLLKFANSSNYWGIADRKQVVPTELKPIFVFLEPTSTPVYFPYNVCTYADPTKIYDDEGVLEEEFNVGFFNSFQHIDGVHPVMKLKSVNKHNTGFKLYSFEDNEQIIGTDNLFKQTWWNDMMDRMDDDSVILSIDIYVDENTVAKLMNFPNIKYKNQDWQFQGFNDYPLSSRDGGLTNITIIKK